MAVNEDIEFLRRFREFVVNRPAEGHEPMGAWGDERYQSRYLDPTKPSVVQSSYPPLDPNGRYMLSIATPINTQFEPILVKNAAGETVVDPNALHPANAADALQRVIEHHGVKVLDSAKLGNSFGNATNYVEMQVQRGDYEKGMQIIDTLVNPDSGTNEEIAQKLSGISAPKPASVQELHMPKLERAPLPEPTVKNGMVHYDNLDLAQRNKLFAGLKESGVDSDGIARSGGFRNNPDSTLSARLRPEEYQKLEPHIKPQPVREAGAGTSDYDRTFSDMKASKERQWAHRELLQAEAAAAQPKPATPAAEPTSAPSKPATPPVVRAMPEGPTARGPLEHRGRGGMHDPVDPSAEWRSAAPKPATAPTPPAEPVAAAAIPPAPPTSSFKRLPDPVITDPAALAEFRAKGGVTSEDVAKVHNLTSSNPSTVTASSATGSLAPTPEASTMSGVPKVPTAPQFQTNTQVPFSTANTHTIGTTYTATVKDPTASTVADRYDITAETHSITQNPRANPSAASQQELNAHGVDMTTDGHGLQDATTRATGESATPAHKYLGDLSAAQNHIRSISTETGGLVSPSAVAARLDAAHQDKKPLPSAAEIAAGRGMNLRTETPSTVKATVSPVIPQTPTATTTSNSASAALTHTFSPSPVAPATPIAEPHSPAPVGGGAKFVGNAMGVAALGLVGSDGSTADKAVYGAAAVSGIVTPKVGVGAIALATGAYEVGKAYANGDLKAAANKGVEQLQDVPSAIVTGGLSGAAPSTAFKEIGKSLDGHYDGVGYGTALKDIYGNIGAATLPGQLITNTKEAMTSVDAVNAKAGAQIPTDASKAQDINNYPHLRAAQNRVENQEFAALKAASPHAADIDKENARIQAVQPTLDANNTLNQIKATEAAKQVYDANAINRAGAAHDQLHKLESAAKAEAAPYTAQRGIERLQTNNEMLKDTSLTESKREMLTKENAKINDSFTTNPSMSAWKEKIEGAKTDDQKAALKNDFATADKKIDAARNAVGEAHRGISAQSEKDPNFKNAYAEVSAANEKTADGKIKNPEALLDVRAKQTAAHAEEKSAIKNPEIGEATKEAIAKGPEKAKADLAALERSAPQASETARRMLDPETGAATKQEFQKDLAAAKTTAVDAEGKLKGYGVDEMQAKAKEASQDQTKLRAEIDKSVTKEVGAYVAETQSKTWDYTKSVASNPLGIIDTTAKAIAPSETELKLRESVGASKELDAYQNAMKAPAAALNAPAVPEAAKAATPTAPAAVAASPAPAAQPTAPAAPAPNVPETSKPAETPATPIPAKPQPDIASASRAPQGGDTKSEPKPAETAKAPQKPEPPAGLDAAALNSVAEHGKKLQKESGMSPVTDSDAQNRDKKEPPKEEIAKAAEPLKASGTELKQPDPTKLPNDARTSQQKQAAEKGGAQQMA